MQVIFDLKPSSSKNTASLRYTIAKFKMVTRQLPILGMGVATCDKMLMFHLCRLLDPSTRRAWELHNLNDENVTLNDLLTLLDRHITGLLMAPKGVSGRLSTPPSTPQVRSPVVRSVNQLASSSSGNDCRCCKKALHDLEFCLDFIKLNPFVRCKKVKKLKACFGCLSYDHTLEACTAPICTHCPHNKVHHRLLCFKYGDEQKQKATVGFISAVLKRMEIEADETAL